MRIINKSRNSFEGTHKGAHISIDRERDGRFYIQVRWKDGGMMYDGYAPEEIRTMAAAKREAIKGAAL